MNEISRLQIEVNRWGNEQFGVGSPRATIAHLKKEVDELAEHPGDIMEYADCLTLLLHAAKRAGIHVDTIIDVSWEKLDINRHREWGEPDEDGVVEHIRETDEAVPEFAEEAQCPDKNCDGMLRLKDVSDECSCHINPPCHACVSAPIECDTCGLSGLEAGNG